MCELIWMYCCLCQARNDDLQQEYGKLQAEFDKVVEDNKAVLEQNQQEFLQAKQQCENDMAKLKGTYLCELRYSGNINRN